MEDKDVNVAQQTADEVVEQKNADVVETQEKGVNPTEVLRTLSKKLSVNLFDKEGLTQLEEKLNAKDNNLQQTQTKLTEYEKQVEEFKKIQGDYEFKISALGEGFSKDSLDEVLALAKVHTKEGQTIQDGLKVVKEKFGSVLITADEFGIQHNDIKGDNVDLPKNDMEQFMASNDKYAKYYNKNKK